MKPVLVAGPVRLRAAGSLSGLAPMWGLALWMGLCGCAGHRDEAARQEPVDAEAQPASETVVDDVDLRRPGIQHLGGGKPRLLPTIVYDCDDGSRVVTQLEGQSGGLWVFLGDEWVLLPRVPSASGTHYSDGIVSVWSKGMSATIEMPHAVRQCEENRRESVLEDARMRGVEFRASGNEPGWTLEIDSQWTVISVDHGQTVYTMVTRPPVVFEAARRTTYDLGVAGESVRIVIEERPCSDSMSGETSSAAVTVTLEERTLRGCGRSMTPVSPALPRNAEPVDDGGP